jgi:hypothetical protein
MLNPFRRRPLPGAPAAHSSDRRVPSLERLEDRMVPAVIHPVVHTAVQHAGTIAPGQSDVVSTQTTSVSYDASFKQTPTDTSSTVSVNQFNPSLGVLTEVDIIATGSLQNRVQMENLGPQAHQFQCNVGGTLTYLLPGTQPLTSSPSTVLSASLPAFDGVPDLSGPSSKDFGNVTLAGTFSEASITSPQALAAYIGTGKVAVSQSAVAQSSVSGPGNLLAMITTTAQGDVQVVYNYLPEASIAGNVYYDVHKQGSLQPGDPPIGNVLLTLAGTDAFGNSVHRTTHTSSTGTYSFNDLMPGTYEVSETQPAGYRQGTNTLGSLGGQIQGDHILSIPVNAGDQGTQYNFGEILNPSRPPQPPPNPPTPPVTPPLVPSKFFFFGSTLGDFGW